VNASHNEIERRPGPFAIFGAMAAIVLIWAVNFPIGKAGLMRVPAMAMAAFRVVTSALTMIPVYFASRAGKPRQRYSGREIWTFAYLGFFLVVINQGCFTVGLAYTTVGHSSMVIAAGPIFILALARAMRLEPLTALKIAGIALAFAGVTLLALENGRSLHSSTLAGDLLTLTGSLGYAFYTVLGKSVAARYPAIEMTALNCFFGGAVALPVAIREAIVLTRSGGWSGIGWTGWGAMFYMAIFSSVIAYTLYFWTLRYVSASRMGSLNYLQPLIAAALGISLLGEHLTPSVAAGGALILTGVYAIERRDAEAIPRTDPSA